MVKATDACLHRVFLAPRPWWAQRPLAFTVFLAPKPWCRQRRLAFTVLFGTKTMVKATAACLHRVFLAEGWGLKGWRGWRGSVWRIATEPNRNAAILAIHRALNTALSTEPPDYNHAYGAGWVWAQSF